MPIRVLHFADLHVGMENYGKIDPQTGISSRIRDFLDRLDEVIAYALDNDADLVIFAGDAFKTRDPDPTQQREFAKRIKGLADRVPVFMLVGNHDVPGMAAKATSIDIFRTLDVPNVTVGRQIGSQVIQTKSGPVFVGWVPFPVRSRLLAQEEHKGASVEQLDKAVEKLIIEEMADLTRDAADQNMPRVLVGHFSVGGAVYGSERSVMLGRDLVIPKSALADPVWDYVCFAPSQPVVMADGSIKRIDQVDPGDKVLNHNGSTDKVTQVTSREYKGPLYSVSAYYLPSPVLRITPDHPVLVVRREELLCPIPSRAAQGLVCTTSTSRTSYPCNTCTIPNMPRLPQPEYIRAGELHVGDFLCVPIPKTTASPIAISISELASEIATESRDGQLRIRVKGQGWDESVPDTVVVDQMFARLCGYFLAEGSLMASKRHTVAGIQFTFGSHETAYQHDVINLAHRIFGKRCTIGPNKQGRSITICVSSRLIGETFRQLFRSEGSGCKATRLPEFMTQLPFPLERQILVGTIRGDGHLAEYDRSRRRGLITHATISESLAWQLWRLALRQGLSPALRVNRRNHPKTPNPIFTIDLYGMEVHSLAQETFGKSIDAPQKTRRLCFRGEKYLYIPVRSIEVDEYAGAVWNIEVENSHTYVAGGVAVHNCLGHIHKHQNLTANEEGKPPVVYSGSLERIDFGEEVEDKGFCWMSLERGRTTWEFVKVSARPFVTIKVDGRDEADPTSAVVARIQSRSLKGAIVRVSVKLKEAQVASLREREIEKALREAEVNNIAAIGKDVERETRAQLGGASPETLTPAQLVEKYFMSKGRSPEEAVRYVKAAESLLGNE